MAEKNQRIPISQFASLCGVSRQTLIYYDREGLFHPEYTDSKGYRYYTIGQHEEFSLINMLTEAGTPLKEIRIYLRQKSPENLLNLLKQKQAELEKRLARLDSVSKSIGRRIDTTQEALSIADAEAVTVERHPPEPVILSKSFSENPDEDLSEITVDFETHLRLKNIESLGFGARIKKEDLTLPFVYRIENFYSSTVDGSDAETVKPGGLYASTCHRGGYDDLGRSYERLLREIEARGLSVAGDAYETDLLSSYMVDSEKHYLTRISVMVE